MRSAVNIALSHRPPSDVRERMMGRSASWLIVCYILDDDLMCKIDGWPPRDGLTVREIVDVLYKLPAGTVFAIYRRPVKLEVVK